MMPMSTLPSLSKAGTLLHQKVATCRRSLEGYRSWLVALSEGTGKPILLSFVHLQMLSLEVGEELGPHLHRTQPIILRSHPPWRELWGNTTRQHPQL